MKTPKDVDNLIKVIHSKFQVSEKNNLTVFITKAD